MTRCSSISSVIASALWPAIGTYYLRIANVTGNDLAETYIIFPVSSSSAPALPGALVIPFLMVLAATPILLRRRLKL